MAERPFPKYHRETPQSSPEDHRTSVWLAFVSLTLMFALFTGSTLAILRLRDVH